MKRPAFWLLLGLLSIAAGLVGYHYFPQAFSIVSLDITMDREHALEQARGIMTRDRLGPPGYRQAASFGLDEEAQTFVELEGGGKEAFTRMMRDGLYSAYTWRVRHFAEGHATRRRSGSRRTAVRTDSSSGSTRTRRAPRCQPLRREPSARRGRARTGRWTSPASRSSSRVRSADRAAAWITPSRTSVPRRRSTKGDTGCELVVSGDRLTGVTPLRQDPGSVHAGATRTCARPTKRSAWDRPSGMVLLYVFGGIGVGLFFMLRRRLGALAASRLSGASPSAFCRRSPRSTSGRCCGCRTTRPCPRTTFFAQQVRDDRRDVPAASRCSSRCRSWPPRR